MRWNRRALGVLIGILGRRTKGSQIPSLSGLQAEGIVIISRSEQHLQETVEEVTASIQTSQLKTKLLSLEGGGSGGGREMPAL